MDHTLLIDVFPNDRNVGRRVVNEWLDDDVIVELHFLLMKIIQSGNEKRPESSPHSPCNEVSEHVPFR